MRQQMENLFLNDLVAGQNAEAIREGIALFERINALARRVEGDPRRVEAPIVAALEAPSKPIVASLAARLSPYERELCDARALDYGVFLGCKTELAQARSAATPAAAAQEPARVELTEEELAAAARGRVDPALMLLAKVDPSGRLLDEELVRRKLGGAALPSAGEPIAGVAQLTEIERQAAEARGLDTTMVALMKTDPTGKLFDAEYKRRKAARAK